MHELVQDQCRGACRNLPLEVSKVIAVKCDGIRFSARYACGLTDISHSVMERQLTRSCQSKERDCRAVSKLRRALHRDLRFDRAGPISIRPRAARSFWCSVRRLAGPVLQTGFSGFLAVLQPPWVVKPTCFRVPPTTGACQPASMSVAWLCMKRVSRDCLENVERATGAIRGHISRNGLKNNVRISCADSQGRPETRNR